MNHVDDATLALVAEHVPVDASARDHVDGCDVCRTRLARLHALQRALGETPALPSVVGDVEARLAQPPWWRLRLPALASAAAAAAVLVVVVVGGRDESGGPAGFTPRGAGAGPELLLVADGRVVDDDDDDDASITSTAAVRADLVHPDPQARHLVVGVDDAGHVHWLRPAFVDAARPPACPAPVGGDRVVGDETMALPLAPGSLELRLYAIDAAAPCDVVALDAALTAKTPPEALRLVQRQRVVVTP